MILEDQTPESKYHSPKVRSQNSRFSLLASHLGFSLVELILAISIASIVIIGSTTIFLSAQSRSLESTHQAAATSAATSQIESLRQMDFDAITVGTTNFPAPEVPRLISAELNVVATNPDLKSVTATVTWREGSRTASISVPTYIARYGINRK